MSSEEAGRFRGVVQQELPMIEYEETAVLVHLLRRALEEAEDLHHKVRKARELEIFEKARMKEQHAC